MTYNPIIPAAEGGIVTYDGAYRIHTFIKNGTFIVKTPMNVQVLVVGGGGGGGTSSGGGGGGGGVQTNSSLAVTSQSYSVTVGLGGAGRTSSALSGYNGSNSTFSTITAIGGGGGGGYEALGGNGGCGGGGGSSATSGNQKVGGIGSQGYNGGNGAYYPTGHAGAGGGGGAGATGANAVDTVAGAGGSGLASTITGSTVYYAGGGGGGGSTGGAGAVGGIGGGGDGSTGASNAFSGAANTGGGGGGARTWGTGNSASGGSGIVIIRYPVSADGSFTSFTHRKRITINNSSGGILTNYQVPITVIYAAAMRADFGDIRFASSDSLNITYWIESKTNSTTAAVWLRLNLSTGDNILYIYYGNPALTDTSSGSDIFEAYDLTSYTEVDPSSYYTVTPNKVDVVAIPNSAAGLTTTVAGAGDFRYDCEIYRSTMTGDGGMHILLADSVSYPAWNSWGSNNGIGFTLMNNANDSFAMVEKYVSGARSSSGSVYFDINTLYYITLTRVGSTLTLNVYTDTARTTHRTGSPGTLAGVPITAFTKLLVAQNDSVYGGAKTYYIQNPRLRKYTATIPTVIVGSEETPANITATSMTITPSENPCRVGICTVSVDITWTNNGGTSGDFIPNITIDGTPYSSPYPLQSLGAGLPVTKTFTISGLAVGTRNICPYPN